MNEVRIAEIVRRMETDLAELKAELSGVSSRVHRFIDAHFFRVSGEKLAFSYFYRAFRESLPAGERPEWTKLRVIQELAPLTVLDTGRSDQPTKMIAGLSPTAPHVPTPEPEPLPKDPNYDGLAMCRLTRKMIREERMNREQVADKLNEQGLRDEWGRPWTGDEVDRVYND